MEPDSGLNQCKKMYAGPAHQNRVLNHALKGVVEKKLVGQRKNGSWFQWFFLI